MWFLIGGVLLLALWLADIGPFGRIHWAWILVPFALAAAWWTIADAIGLSQRRAVRKMEERKQARRQRDMAALGLDVQREKRVRVMRDKRPPPAPEPPPRRDPRA